MLMQDVVKQSIAADVSDTCSGRGTSMSLHPCSRRHVIHRTAAAAGLGTCSSCSRGSGIAKQYISDTFQRQRRRKHTAIIVCFKAADGSASSSVHDSNDDTAARDAAAIAEAIELIPPGAGTSRPATSVRVPVVFELGKHCTFGHVFAIVGSSRELGNWDPNKAVKLKWSEGDVWRNSIPIPVGVPVAFKYIEEADDGSLVGWGEDVAGGCNLTVTVEPDDQLISGYRITLLPDTPKDTDTAADAAEPAGHIMLPYLMARLDIAAILQVSASFFREIQLAEAGGLTAQMAHDIVTDRVLVEQGLLSRHDLERKWSLGQPESLTEQQQKLGELAGIAGEDDRDDRDDSDASCRADNIVDEEAVEASAVQLINPTDVTGATNVEGDPHHAGSTPCPQPAPSTAGRGARWNEGSGVSCWSLGADTKLVSAHESASTIDIDSHKLADPSKPVVEVEGCAWDVLDPITVDHPITLPQHDTEATAAGEETG